MSATTSISWTDHTWNPWVGCTQVSPGCAHCYMFAGQKRFGHDPTVVRRTKTWDAPLAWQRAAIAAGQPRRVFTCSWSDWFHADADAWRREAWAVIRRCPQLHFQILTKRAERIASQLPPDWGAGYPNVWLGVSVENDRFVGRIDALRAVPCAVRFVSAEPLLGPLPSLELTGIDWLIIGGESGVRFRRMELAWVRALVERARAADTRIWLKQRAAVRAEQPLMVDGIRIREFPGDRLALDDILPGRIRTISDCSIPSDQFSE